MRKGGGGKGREEDRREKKLEEKRGRGRDEKGERREKPWLEEDTPPHFIAEYRRGCCKGNKKCPEKPGKGSKKRGAMEGTARAGREGVQ